MKIKANNIKEISRLQIVAEKEQAVDEKLDELIALISACEFDSETIKQFERKFSDAIVKKNAEENIIDAFKIIDEKNEASRDELLDEFSTLLLSNKIDSKISSRYLKSERFSRIFLMFVGIVMITLGFAMIVMPAPPYFEMFTIYYFSLDDGVTLMDLISLAIVFSGIFVFIRSLYKKPTI